MAAHNLIFLMIFFNNAINIKMIEKTKKEAVKQETDPQGR